MSNRFDLRSGWHRHSWFAAFACLFWLMPASVVAQRVMPTKPIYAPGENIVISYTGFQGHPKDWIGIATREMPEANYLVWQYTPGTADGTVTFSGMAYGEYEIRGYFENGGVVKARAMIRVGNADENVAARTSQPTYRPGEKISVTFSGLPGNNRDWIGLAIPGSPDEKYVLWQYTQGQQRGTIEFSALPEGAYEVRTYFNNEGVVRSRYPFTVSLNAVSEPDQLCRTPLSVFFAGLTGLGAAWARTTCEPTNMSAGGINDIQAVLRNARDGLQAMRECLTFDISELDQLISSIPSLTNVQAEAQIQALVRKLQPITANTNAVCTRSVPLSALYVSAVHLGAAQAHASCQICRAAPMPMAYQTVIRNHLNTARDAFAAYLPCVPGVSLPQFDAVPLNSPNSLEAHTHIVGLHTNLLWNISLSDCCCNCR